MEVTLVEPDYPPPAAPTTSKDDVLRNTEQEHKALDSKAKKTPASCLDSTDELLKFLHSDVTSELSKVRLIFVWLSNQPLLTMTFNGHLQPGSPKEWLKRIKYDRQLYTDFFAVLCRKAGVKCAVVEGFAKGAGFEVGDTEGKKCPRTRWNAVHLMDEWRLVNVPWASIATETLEGDQYVLVEKDDKSVKEKGPTKLTCEVKQDKDEFWFLTDPEFFNPFCHAKDPAWQLLESVWTDREFFASPRYAESYFQSCRSWELLSEDTGTIKAKKGKCLISYSHPYSAKKANLRYNLFFKTAATPEGLHRYVIIERARGRINLICRLPHKGHYKIQIAGELDGKLTSLEEFVIDAFDVPKQPQPFPEDGKELGPTDDIEGQGVTAEEERGVLTAMPGERVVFNFSTDRHRAAGQSSPLTASLTNNQKKAEELNLCIQVTSTQDGGKELTTVTVHLPAGKSSVFEYCLTILKGAAAVFRYILTGDKDLTFERYKGDIEYKHNLLTAIQNNKKSEVNELLKQKKFNQLDANIRSKINIFTSRRTMVKDIREAMNTDDPQPLKQTPEEYGKKFGEDGDSIMPLARAVEALMICMKNSNSPTHVADLEEALRNALKMELKDNVNIQNAETALVKLYESELRKAVRDRSQKAVEQAIRRADRSCVASRVKETEAYKKAVNLPKNWH